VPSFTPTRRAAAILAALAIVTSSVFVSAPAVAEELSAPVITSPANNSIQKSLTMSARWTPVDGATEYETQTWFTNDPGTVFPGADLTFGNFGPAGFDEPGIDGTIGWHVRAVTPTNDAPWSAPATFTIDTIAPVVAITSPAAGAVVEKGSSLPFTATIVDANPATSYLSVDGVGVPGGHQFNATNTNFSWSIPTANLALGAHVAKFEHRDNAGNKDDAVSIATVAFTVVDTVSPGAITVLTPADNAYLPSADIEVTWSDPEAGNTYEIQATNIEPAAGATVIQNPPFVFSNQSSPAVFANSSYPTYWYQIRAKDAAGNLGPWTAIRKATVDTVAPSAPTNLAPGSGYVLEASQMSWNASTDASPVTYEVITSRGPYTNPATGQLTLDVTPVPLSDLSATGTPYAFQPGALFWQVRATDAAGNVSPWSAVSAVGIIGVPQVVTPYSTEVITGDSVTTTWTASAGIGGVSTYNVKYRWDADNNGSLESESTDTVLGSVLTHTRSLPTQGNWSVSVQARYNNGLTAGDRSSALGPWSTPISFTHDSVGPVEPQPVNPENGKFQSDANPTLVWNAGGDAVQYIVRTSLNANRDLTNELNDGAVSRPATTSLTEALTGLPQGYTFWQVRGVDANGNLGPWSSIWSVGVDTVGPVAPQPYNPENGKTQSNAAPTLQWLTVSDAVTYEVRTSASAGRDGNNMLSGADAATRPTTTSLTDALTGLPQGTLFWQVRAFDAAGNAGAWSSIWSLGVDTVGPVAPQPYNPQNGKTQSNASPTLQWLTVSDAVTYEVRTSTSAGRDGNNKLSGADAATRPTTTSLTDALTGLPEGKLFWQVRAFDAAGNAGAWSSIWSLGVDTLAPTAPTSLSPSGWTVDAPGYTWAASTDASSVTYEVNYANSGHTDGTGALDNAATLTTGITATNLPRTFIPGGSWWQVRAKDAAGNYSPWSNSVVNYIGVPTITSPTAAQVITTSDVTTTWTSVYGVGGVSGYIVQYNADNDGNGSFETQVEKTVGGSELSDTWTLTAQGASTVKVRAVYNSPIGGSPLGPWSDVVSFSRNAVVPAVTCVGVEGWTAVDLAPTLTAEGVVFDGPHAQSVNYYQRVSAGNAQGLTGMSYTIAPGTTGYKAELKVEVDPNTSLGGATLSYATLSTIGTASEGTIDAQNALWYTSKIAYASPGGMGNPLSWNAIIALMPNNTLLSAPSLHLQTNSTADSHSVVTSVTSSCGTTDFTTPAPAQLTLTAPTDGGAFSEAPELAWTAADGALYEVRYGPTGSVDSDGGLDAPLAVTLPTSTVNSIDTGSLGLDDGVYFWQVRAKESVYLTPGPWSAVRSFSLDTQAPAAVDLAAPVDASTDTDGTFDFSWVAPETGDLEYEFEVTTATPEVLVDGSFTGAGVRTSTDLTALPVETAADGVYSWHVRAIDAVGNVGAWSPVWTVTVARPVIPVTPETPETEAPETESPAAPAAPVVPQTPAAAPAAPAAAPVAPAAGSTVAGQTEAGSATEQTEEEAPLGQLPTEAFEDDEAINADSASDGGLVWWPWAALLLAVLAALGVILIRRRLKVQP